MVSSTEARADAPQLESRQSALIRTSFYRRYGKRLLDVVLAFALLLALIPFIVCLAVLVTLASGWPPLYRAERLGKDGRLFYMWKIRTMVKGADQMLDEWLATGHPIGQLHRRGLKPTNDPRETPVGRLLRRASMDELPQLLNVVKGSMSLVGPRPYKVEDLLMNPLRAGQILAVRPGLTGPWQVGPRNSAPIDERLEIDGKYIRNITLAGDLAILAKTIMPVVKRTGL